MAQDGSGKYGQRCNSSAIRHNEGWRLGWSVQPGVSNKSFCAYQSPRGMSCVGHTRLFHGLAGPYLNEHGPVYYAAAPQLDSLQHTKHKDHQHASVFNIYDSVRVAQIYILSTIQMQYIFLNLCRNASAVIQSKVINSVFKFKVGYII